MPALVAVAVYLPALRNGFAYDDEAIIVRNARIHQWGTLLAALRAPYWFDAGHLYRPLTTLSFGLDWIIGHGSPLPFHVMNVVWHAAVTALVARLVLRWWPPGAALGAGLWFAIHPVHVEAVANVVGRSELLCAAALLAVALVAARSAPSPLLIALLAACAMASKESGAAAPIVAWAVAWIATGSTSPDAAPQARRAAWRSAGTAALGVGLVLAVRLIFFGDIAGDNAHAAFRPDPATHPMLLALASLPRAVGLILAPQLPRTDYSPTDVQLDHPDVPLALCGALIVTGAAVALFRHIRRPTPWTMAVVFAAATLAPVSNLLLHTGVVIAERTLYSPSIAAALAMGVGVQALWVRRARVPLALVGAGAAASLIFTEVSIPTWRDTPAVVAAMQARAPDSYRGYSLAAARQSEAGDIAAAHASYRAAIARFGRDPVVLFHAGVNALAAGDTAAALQWLARSVVLDSSLLRARTALVYLSLHRGDTVRARGLLADGLRIAPDQRSWRVTLDRLSPPSAPVAQP